MEEAHKTHKDQPFGWVSAMQGFMHAGSRRPAPWHEQPAPKPAPAPVTDDLHNLAGPH